MTPFGEKLRSLRAARRCQLKDLAKALRVSSAYLSALEHGHRGKPSPGLVQQVAAYFNLAWEEVDELKALAELSDPRVTIDTAGLTPEATELANRLAARIDALSDAEIARLLTLLKKHCTCAHSWSRQADHDEQGAGTVGALNYRRRCRK